MSRITKAEYKGYSALAISFCLSAQAEVTANIAASSNYYWRGITQTDDGAAVSGGLDYSNESGFYAGTWVSNIDFGDSASYEMDLYAGYAGEVKGMSFDFGYIHYGYPDASGDIDFGEIYAALGWQYFTFKLSHLATAQSDSTTEEDMLYAEVSASFPVFTDSELTLHLGRSSGDTVMEWTGEDDTYMDYGVSLSTQGFTFGLVKTDLDSGDDLKAYVSYGLDFNL
ncbi:MULTISPECIES: TorF family putative porin [unclassified Pseudoalteromonas]|uniref:TorF family putative porin n=1 Tax=unclassified Pseudoalteromonas TaxID=194690 RepID=UPI00301421E6